MHLRTLNCMGFPESTIFLQGRVCAYPEIINQSFEVTPDFNSNGNIIEDVTYGINIIQSKMHETVAHCERFHVEPNCKIGVLNRLR